MLTNETRALRWYNRWAGKIQSAWDSYQEAVTGKASVDEVRRLFGEYADLVEEARKD